MILAPTNRRVIRPYDKPSFEHTQRYGLIKDHPLGPAGGNVLFLIFNEGSGNKAFDLSGKGNDITIGANVSWGAGKFGPCLVTDSLSGSVVLPSISVRAISFWYKTIDLGANCFLIDARTGLTNGYIYITGGGTGVDVGAGWDKTYLDGIQVTLAASDFAVGTWHHIYLEAASNFTDDTKLFARYTGDEYLDSFLDVVFLHYNILTASEIALLYQEPFCMVEKKARTVYFFVPTGGVVYQELNLTVTANASVAESDTHQMVETEKVVNADTSVSESDAQQMVDTGKEVSADASVSKTDTQQMVETGKAVEAIAWPAVIDTQTMVETELGVSAEGSVDGVDTMGLLAHIAAFMILRQSTS